MNKKILILLILLSGLFSGCGLFEIDGNFNTNLTNKNLYVSLPNQTSDDGHFIVTGSEIHSHLHRGLMWGYSDTYHFDLSGDTVNYMGCTASNISVQFVDFSTYSDAGPITIELYEAPNISVLGTMVYGGNLNRQLNTNHTILIYKDSTFNDLGLLLYPTIIPGDSKSGGFGTIPTEWILRNSTCYVYKFTNGDGPNVNIYPVLLWYEDPLK